jgi:hypothetical protein
VASHVTAAGENGAAAEPWISEHRDLSCAFVAGVSVDGNIAHHVAARGVSITGCWWSTLSSTGSACRQDSVSDSEQGSSEREGQV